MYEGSFFGIPLVVAEDTLQAERVREHGIGIVVDPRIDDFAHQLLDQLTLGLITELSQKSLDLDQKYLVESYDEIISKVIEQG